MFTLEFWVQTQRSKVSQPLTKYVCVSRNARVAFRFGFKEKEKLRKYIRRGCLVALCL